MSRPPTESHPDCKRQNHLWIIPLKPGEQTRCRRCGKTRRSPKRPTNAAATAAPEHVLRAQAVHDDGALAELARRT